MFEGVFIGNEIVFLVICGLNEIFFVGVKLCFWLIGGRFSIEGVCGDVCDVCEECVRCCDGVGRYIRVCIFIYMRENFVVFF